MDDHADCENEIKELLQKFYLNRLHGVLDAFNVIDECRKQLAGSVLLEERDRTPQDYFIQVITQVGDHAEAGVVHQIRACIIADAFQQGGNDQGERNHCPDVMNEMRNKLLQRELIMRAGNFIESNRRADSCGMQDVVKDWLHEQDPEGL